MVLRGSVGEWLSGAVVAGALVMGLSSPASAQSAAPAADATAPAAPEAGNTGRITLTAGLDFASAYMFRGIYQEDGGAIAWPAFDVGVTLAEGDGALKKVLLDVGMWNSMHSGATGSDGPADDMWYESDFFASLMFTTKSGLTVGPLFTAYTSPNKTFGTVTEIAFKFAYADADKLGKFALSPYALVAFEIDGKADGGERSGKYLELGIAPGIPLAAGKASLTFPVKLGLSLSDYYEGPSTKDTLGYLDTGVAVSIPLSKVTKRYGAWAVRGGVDLLTLGENTKYINHGDRTKVVGQFGIGLSY